MRKIFSKIFVFVILFIVYTNVYAQTYYGVVKTQGYDSTVNIRKKPSTLTADGHHAVTRNGAVFPLVSMDLHPNISGCTEGWYQIYYSGSKTGYLCSNLLDIYESKSDGSLAATDCEKNMESLGFPASYWGGLCYLKEKYPTWEFKAIETNLDWDYVIEKESACRISYIATSNSELIDPTCNGQYASTWYPASKKAVAYSMDPRTSLSPRWIFQFEQLSYDIQFENTYVNATYNIIKNTNFYSLHEEYIVSDIFEAGKTTKVSPIHLSSRMLQELGSSTSLLNLYSGVYDGFENKYYGYYNFFNFGVTDSCATSNGTTYCGLNYAFNKGWDSVFNAIKGASSQISANYVDEGQDSLYLQKFNVVPKNPSALFLHQYMTNIEAPKSEAGSMFKVYNQVDMLDYNFKFSIPVYKNMTADIDLSGSGASGEESDPLSNLPITTIITSSGYYYSQKTISNISPNTNTDDIKGKLESKAGKGNILIYNSKGQLVADKLLGTNYKIKIITELGEEVLDVVVKGDTSGDGISNALDLLQVQKHILGLNKLSTNALKAADTSGDSLVNALDLLQIQKHILEINNLE